MVHDADWLCLRSFYPQSSVGQGLKFQQGSFGLSYCYA